MFTKFVLVPAFAAAALIVAGCNDRREPAAGQNGTVQANAIEPAVATAGEGAPTGGTCGTIAGIQCAAATDFCKNPIGQCGVADAAGTCTARPQICPQNYLPVCGCDGKTYGNACEADRAGVNVQSPGKCPAGG